MPPRSAELVVAGETGYHFRTGDAEDLAAKLVGLLEDPGQLDELYAGDRELRGMGDLAADIEAIYEEVTRG